MRTGPKKKDPQKINTLHLALHMNVAYATMTLTGRMLAMQL